MRAQIPGHDSPGVGVGDLCLLSVLSFFKFGLFEGVSFSSSPSGARFRFLSANRVETRLGREDVFVTSAFGFFGFCGWACPRSVLTVAFRGSLGAIFPTCTVVFLVCRLGTGFCSRECSEGPLESVVLVEGAGLFATLESSSLPRHVGVSLLIYLVGLY